MGDDPAYAVALNGKDYLVYSAEDLDAGADTWALATETFFRMVNDTISPTQKERAYSLYSGNDLSLMFLHPDVLPFFDTMPGAERPYTPSRDAPNFRVPVD